MKAIIAVAVPFVLTVGFAQELAPELAPVAGQYKADIAALASQKDTAQTRAIQLYITTLDGAEKTVAKVGNIKAVAAIVKERAALKAGTFTPAIPDDLPQTLAPARRACIDDVARVTKETAAKRGALNFNYLKALAVLEAKAAPNSDLAKQLATEKEALIGVINSNRASSLVGKWHFANRGEGNFEVAITAEGTCVLNKGEDSGTWKIEEGFMVLHWGNGVKSRIALSQTGDSRAGETMPKGSTSWVPNIKLTRIK